MDKPLPVQVHQPTSLTVPERLSDVDLYEVYVRITPIRYYDMPAGDGDVQRAERRGESYGSVAYVTRFHDKEAGAFLHIIRALLYHAIEGFFGVRL